MLHYIYLEFVSPVVDTLGTVAVLVGVAAVPPLAAAEAPVPGRVAGGGAAVLQGVLRPALPVLSPASRTGDVKDFCTCVSLSFRILISSAAIRLIGEVVQSRRRPLLGPSPG